MADKTESKKTAVQFLKNTAMGFVVTIFESLSLTPLYKMFGFITNESPRLFIDLEKWLGTDAVMFIAKMIATFAVGVVNFAICKKFIFTEEKQ